MAARGDAAQTGGWRILVPWMILPAALAVITLVEWLKHRGQRLGSE